MYQIIIALLLTFSYFQLHSQTNYSLNMELGIGINNNLTIAEKKVVRPHALLTAIHGTVQRNASKKTLLETSLFGMFIKNSGELGNSNFVIKKYKLGLDLAAGYNFSKKTQLLVGPSVSTMPDLLEINLRKPDNLKFELLLKLNRYITPQLSFSLRARTLLNRLGKQFLIEDPKHSVTIGLNYNLRKL